jgi:hypothetical protein
MPVLSPTAKYKNGMWNVLLPGEGSDASGKIPRQRTQALFGDGLSWIKKVPPHDKAAAGLSHRKITANGNTVHTIIGSLEQVAKITGKIIGGAHEKNHHRPAIRRRRISFSQRSLGKGVRRYRRFFGLRSLLGVSSVASGRIEFVSRAALARQFYRLSYRFQLLSTPRCRDAVTFNSWREAPPQRDFHPPMHAHFQAH